MKQTLFGVIAVPILLIILFNSFESKPKVEALEDLSFTIAGTVRSNDTMQSIFERHDLDIKELPEIVRISKKEYNLSRLSVGNIYSFELDRKDHSIRTLQYGIDDKSYLSVVKLQDGFRAEKRDVHIETRAGSFSVAIKDSLIGSMPGTHPEYHKLALKLSEIYAWDIDFSNDIRKGDTVKIIVEELWSGEVFQGYGNILASEIVNNGRKHLAYRFEYGGYAGYYDDKGKSLRKTLLRSPLKFKYISSRFSKRRYHPVLRIYRPHLGVDYAAPTGTPVSAAGSGTVLFSGYKGQNGRMVKIKHKGGYITYYGHLSRIPKKIRKGIKVSQGDTIGYVGSTGLSTGPHLDYRIKRKGRFVNPLKIKLPRGQSVPKKFMARYKNNAKKYDILLASMSQSLVAMKEKNKHSG
jgi:murein DD-endopeptidase MepM/ murein hydrolase activator NlpD